MDRMCVEVSNSFIDHHAQCDPAIMHANVRDLTSNHIIMIHAIHANPSVKLANHFSELSIHLVEDGPQTQ